MMASPHAIVALHRWAPPLAPRSAVWDTRFGEAPHEQVDRPGLRVAPGLHRDFELDANALSLLLSYIELIDELEEELRALRAGVAR